MKGIKTARCSPPTNRRHVDRVEGYDIWDKKHQRLVTVVATHDKLLQDSKWPLEYEGFPCEILYYNEQPDPHIPPFHQPPSTCPHQREINWISSLQLNHIRTAASTKMLMREDAMEVAEIDQLTKGPPNVVVSVSGTPAMLSNNSNHLISLRIYG